MSRNSLGVLTLDLVVKAGAFTAGMNAAERQANKNLSAIEKRAYAFGKNFGVALKAGAVAASAAAVALTTTLKQSINSMDDLSKAAQRVGISTEEFSKLNYAAGLADVSIGTLTGSLGKLTKSQAAALNATSEQAKVFDALGISIKDADGKLRGSSDVLADFADRFKALKGSPEAMAAGFSLFGRSFQELIPLLKDGGDGIRAAGAELESFGGVLSTEAGKNAEEFNDNLTRLKTAAMSLSQAVAADLLPDLVALSEQWVGMAKDGNKVKETASGIADGLRAIGQVVGSLTPIWTAFVDVVRGLTINLAAMGDVLGGVGHADFDRITRGLSGIREGYGLIINGRDKAESSNPGNGRASTGGRRGRSVTIRDVGQDQVDAYTRQLQAALANAPGAKSKGGGKGGKSEATKQAEEAEKALRAAAEAQASWHARILDMSADLAGPTAKVLRDYEKGMEELTGQFNDGKVRLDDYAKAQDLLSEIRDKDLAAIKAQITPLQEVNAAIAEQMKLIGMSADDMEVWNNLKYAGVAADSEFGKQVIESTKALQEQRDAMNDQIEGMDAIRDGSKDFLKDLITGSKSFKDAFLDALDSIEDKFLDMILQNFSDQLFGKQGDPGGGSTGGWINTILGLFSSSGWGGMSASSFGAAGYAAGGNTKPWSVSEVNERGFEMASVGGKDYLLTGAQSVAITPNHKLRGRGAPVVNQTIQVTGTVDPRSATQLALETSRRMQMAASRFR